MIPTRYGTNSTTTRQRHAKPEYLLTLTSLKISKYDRDLPGILIRKKQENKKNWFLNNI